MLVYLNMCSTRVITSDIGDLVPHVAANALSVTLGIVENTYGGVTTGDITPEPQFTGGSTSGNTVFVYKSGEHYDGLVPAATCTQSEIGVIGSVVSITFVSDKHNESSKKGLKMENVAGISQMHPICDMSPCNVKNGNVHTEVPCNMKGKVNGVKTGGNGHIDQKCNMNESRLSDQAPSRTMEIYSRHDGKKQQVSNESFTDFSYIKITKTFMKTPGITEYISILSYVNDHCETRTVDQISHTNIDQCSAAAEQADDQYPSESPIKVFRRNHAKNLITCYLNVNGFRNKFTEISEMLLGNDTDIMFLSETKLDSSFPVVQFNVSGFKCHRADRNSHGGGILCYVRSDLPHRRRTDLENVISEPTESLVIELIVRREKWLLIGLYSPHNRHKRECCKNIVFNNRDS